MAFADVMMVAATSPLFTVFFARIILKEPIYRVDILNVMIVFGGIILIAKPPFLFGNTVTSYFDNADTTIAIVVLFLSSVFLQSGISTMFSTFYYKAGTILMNILKVLNMTLNF